MLPRRDSLMLLANAASTHQPVWTSAEAAAASARGQKARDATPIETSTFAPVALAVRSRALHDAALQLSRERRWADMRAADEAALRCDPGNGDAWYGVGLATLMLNDTLYDDASLACFERAVACEPARPLSPTTAPEGARAAAPASPSRARQHAALGSALAAVRGDFQSALAQYDAALALEPAGAAVHYARAIVLGPSLGRWAEAKDAMARAAELGQPGAADFLPYCEEQLVKMQQAYRSPVACN